MRAQLLALGLLLSLLPAPAGAGTAPGGDLAFLDGLCLVVLDRGDVGALHAAHAAIRSRGGRIAILSEPGLLLGWIPESERRALIGQAGIRAIYDREVAPDLGGRDAQSRCTVEYFNAVKRGDVQRRAEIERSAPAPPRAGDARTRDAFTEWSYLENLRANGFDVAQLRDRGLLAGQGPEDRIQGNSDRMTGTVTVTLVFVESNGTGADPNQYTWTDAAVQEWVNGVNTGLAWWTQQADLYNDCWVAFFVHYVPPTDPRCQQWREMVLHPSGDVAAMVSEVMGHFGYNSGTHFARVDAFNTAQRATYGTNWAYTGFVAFNPVPAPAQLTDGPSAFAYLLGPYSFLLYRSYGWRPDQVFTHESGHIFGACDEYADGCTCGQICIDEPNGNCEGCGPGTSCMMKLNSFNLCSYTDNQLGWQDTSPCAPPPLAPPVATGVSLSQAIQGTSVQVTVSGSNFLYGAFADLGAGITIQSTTPVGSTQLQLQLLVDNAAAPGARDVIVRNRDLQASTLQGAFTVRASTRHYASPSGGNIFPYVTPASAATSIAAAIDAAAMGDSVLVASTPVVGPLVIGKGVVLYGGWINNFTQRDVVNAKTDFDLAGGNVSVFVSGGGTGGLDGFRLRNGRGTSQSTPVSGHYGGGVFVLSSSGLIANCEITSNRAQPGAGFGGGGGIFAQSSQVTIVGNSIHDNAATRGGGIYLYQSSGTLSGNSVSANAVSASTQPAAGAGIYLEACTNVSLADAIIQGNTGATNGGGVYVVGSTNVSFTGGSISDHSVVTNGGAAVVDGSGVAFSHMLLAQNTSGNTNGCINALNGSTLTLDGCTVRENTALLYGGVRVQGGTAHLRHNLVVANSGTGSAGLHLAAVTAGEVLGNTLDGNDATALVLSSSPVEVTNNIVVNSTSTGMTCVGTPPARVDYNLVWNNPDGNYAGCTPGPGSVSAHPGFADTTQANYHLTLHSPAIDAGRTEAGFADPDGSRGDLGIYGSHAFVMDQPSYPKNLSATRVNGHAVLHWKRNPEADVASYAVYRDAATGFRPSAADFVQSVAAPDTTVDLGPAPAAATYYTLAAVDASGYSSGFAAEATLGAATDVTLAVPYRLQLFANVPNPFNPTTTIRYEVDRAGPVTVEVFDLSGRLVQRLLRARQEAGPHGVPWNGSDMQDRRVASGVYVVRLQSGERVLSRKIVALK